MMDEWKASTKLIDNTPCVSQLRAKGTPMEPPQYPAGPFTPEVGLDKGRRDQLIAQIENSPRLVRESVAGLSEGQLDTKYKNWTIRQIVRHLADSHVNSYIRFKLALTEETPTIKPYDEGLWSALPDARLGDIGAPLALLEGLHRCWVQSLRGMTPELFSRSFFHPEAGKLISLSEALASYAWHCQHHTGQILWLRKQNIWT
jgi:hypothetical protein